MKHKKELLCMGVSLLLAAAYAIGPGKDDILVDGIFVRRPSYGEGSREYSLNVEGAELGEDNGISFSVSERRYTEDDIELMFDELAGLIPGIICQKDENPDSISSDLDLPRTVEGYEGIRISWYPEDTELITYDGKLTEKGRSEFWTTGISAVLSYGDMSEEYFFELKLRPRELTYEETQREKLALLMERSDREDPASELVRLPSEIDGEPISYGTGTDPAPVFIIALGVLSAALMHIKPMEDRKKAEREKKRSLLMQYPDMVSKLLLYIGAGLTAKNAWIRILRDQEEGGYERTPAIEEVAKMLKNMEGGMTEGMAYMEFGRSCGLRCYQRLATLLEQNRKNGDRNLRNVLRIEMDEAFEQRKNEALRAGQEASAKLMLPLFLSFLAVMLIIMAPAMMSMG